MLFGSGYRVWTGVGRLLYTCNVFFFVGLESTEQLDECYWFSLFLLAGTKMH